MSDTAQVDTRGTAHVRRTQQQHKGTGMEWVKLNRQDNTGSDNLAPNVQRDLFKLLGFSCVR